MQPFLWRDGMGHLWHWRQASRQCWTDALESKELAHIRDLILPLLQDQLHGIFEKELKNT
jgi:hypothetical protein